MPRGRGHAGVPRDAVGRLGELLGRGRADVAYQESQPITARGGAVLSWAGMRGVVTLAAALTIGPEVDERTLLVTVAFVVAVVSLLLYGGTLPWLIRTLGVSGVDPDRQRAEVAEPVHLNGCRAQREDRRARERGVARQVDEHVDAVGMDLARDRLRRGAR